jgi:membrane-bound serine protease (ClpP class)
MCQRMLLPSVVTAILLLAGSTAHAQREHGEWIFIPSPITSATVAQVKNQTERAINSKQRPARKIIYHFQPGELSSFGDCSDLADFILKDLKGQVTTYAYIDKPLKGHAVLPALACKFLYLGPEGKIGFDEEALQRAGQIDTPKVHKYLDVSELRGRPVALVLKMLDPSLTVYLVDSPKNGKQYKLDLLQPQAARHGIDQKNFLSNEDRLNQPKDVYKPGNPGFYSADEAVTAGLSGRKYSNPQQVAEALGLPGSVIAGNPLLGLDHPPIARIIEVRGKLDRGTCDTLERQISRAVKTDKANCIILEFQETTGGRGEVDNAVNLARHIHDTCKGRVLTVAYIPSRASGAATFLALSCNQIVMGPRGVLGECESLVYREKGRPFPEEDIRPYRESLVQLAEEQGHSPVLVRGLLELPLEIVQVKEKPDPKRADDAPLAMAFLSRGDAEAAKDRWEIVEGAPIKKPNTLLKFDAETAINWGIARHKMDTDDAKALALIYGVDADHLGHIKSDWLDQLVYILAHPITTIFLVIIGFTCLILEFKAPGLGLPAVIAAVCFILVFWSQSWLRGEVNSLAILLFLLGIVLILVELFVFPGIAVTVISGVVLILLSLSLLMVRHWPQSEAEYMELGRNFGIFSGGLAAALFAAIMLARYLPNIPYANRMILQPPDEEAEGGGVTLPLAQSAALLGAIGVTVTELRPAGKARFGDEFVDVVAEGSFLEPGKRVQVIEIDGMRVVVKAI